MIKHLARKMDEWHFGYFVQDLKHGEGPGRCVFSLFLPQFLWLLLTESMRKTGNVLIVLASLIYSQIRFQTNNF